MGKSVEVPAKGVCGYVMFDAEEGTPFFRVYTNDHEFIDYDILHGDLEVEITDDSAALYSGTGNGTAARLDYTSKVLGTKDDD